MSNFRNLMLFSLLYSASSVYSAENPDDLGNLPPPLSPELHGDASRMVGNTIRSHCGELHREIVQQSPGEFEPRTIVIVGWCLDRHNGWIYYPDPVSAAKQTRIRQ
ncbi:MAG: hypothetical protein AAF512_08570 [Pseudomonadota bacterium]